MATNKSQEIELKFMINKDSIKDVECYLNRLGKPTESLQIANIYFDTANKDLHQHKIGLRIRRWNDQSEQTVKMAGSQVGAMSQRPEYNIDYTGSVPQLDLFPADIWPQTINTRKLQEQLEAQFQIDFQRQRWLLNVGVSTIEVAIDEGVIFVPTKDTRQEPICELEAELISGNITDLLQLSELLTQEFTLAPGLLSKAQRGFILAANAVVE
ncbi:hypothetical protein CWE13_12140 [Aliidiomarina shirensis]|uniref:CYTH domain-containing protein n=1 Tax=Aliidiomarina shirensis TaxID=1048642 RepID=A0A432WKN7_9GAMM|nr:CYTH domain-containing protein [Aliidiomarina shirensis]RUO34370.1 hypothetical protein CWE13_12140 [Aliidiomarina shirensis]